MKNVMKFDLVTKRDDSTLVRGKCLSACHEKLANMAMEGHDENDFIIKRTGYKEASKFGVTVNKYVPLFWILDAILHIKEGKAYSVKVKTIFGVYASIDIETLDDIDTRTADLVSMFPDMGAYHLVTIDYGPMVHFFIDKA